MVESITDDDDTEDPSCEDQGLWDCDGQCIYTNWVCDGSSEHGNGSWGPDCLNGADEDLTACCDSGAYSAETHVEQQLLSVVMVCGL